MVPEARAASIHMPADIDAPNPRPRTTEETSKGSGNSGWLGQPSHGGEPMRSASVSVLVLSFATSDEQEGGVEPTRSNLLQERQHLAHCFRSGNARFTALTAHSWSELGRDYATVVMRFSMIDADFWLFVPTATAIPKLETVYIYIYIKYIYIYI